MDIAVYLVDQKDIDALKKAHPKVSIHSFSEFLATATELVDPVPPSADSLACIMCTSGSTGPPKGVLLKHSTIVSAIAGINSVIEVHVAPGERILMYLLDSLLERQTAGGGVLERINPEAFVWFGGAGDNCAVAYRGLFPFAWIAVLQTVIIAVVNAGAKGQRPGGRGSVARADGVSRGNAHGGVGWRFGNSAWGSHNRGDCADGRNQQKCYRVLQDVLFAANVFFQNPALDWASYGVALCCARLFSDGQYLVDLARLHGIKKAYLDIAAANA